MLFTPIFIGYELKIYLSDNSVHQNLHTYRAEKIDYPNITICNPRFFKIDYLRGQSVALQDMGALFLSSFKSNDLPRFAEYNISNELANYMLLALDTTIRKHTDFMNQSFPDGSHIRRLDRLEAELQEVMRNLSLDSLLDLYYLVADRWVLL